MNLRNLRKLEETINVITKEIELEYLVNYS